LNPIIASELYGTGHMGAIYTSMSISLAIGSYVFASKISGAVYDEHAESAHGSASGSAGGASAPTCVGTDCFGLTYIVCFVGCFVVAAGMMVVGLQSRKRYAALYPHAGK